jgi:hypothetical protein
MIVLAAVLRKQKVGGFDVLNKIISKEKLSLLFIRTIKMLRQVGDNSPVLTLDADILENIQNALPLDPTITELPPDTEMSN